MDFQGILVIELKRGDNNISIKVYYEFFHIYMIGFYPTPKKQKSC